MVIDAFRRVGGLELNIVSIRFVPIVFRRVGGLE